MAVGKGWGDRRSADPPKQPYREPGILARIELPCSISPEAGGTITTSTGIEKANLDRVSVLGIKRLLAKLGKSSAPEERRGMGVSPVVAPRRHVALWKASMVGPAMPRV
jgi:hypothetical protein